MLSLLRGRALGIRLRQPLDELWDRRLGVRTFGFNPGIGAYGEPGWASHYEPMPYRDILAGMRAAGLGQGSRFVDLGCGLGRAVFAAAWMGVDEASGVELVHQLAAGAEANRRRSRPRTGVVRIVHGNALDHPVGAASHVYMFHSFGPEIIAPIFDRARADRAIAGVTTPLRVIYANPVCNDVFERLGWFRPIAFLPARRHRLSTANPYDVAVWESVDQDRR